MLWAVPLSRPDVFTSLEKGVIDAADASAYINNATLGFHKVATCPLYSGVHLWRRRKGDGIRGDRTGRRADCRRRPVRAYAAGHSRSLMGHHSHHRVNPVADYRGRVIGRHLQSDGDHLCDGTFLEWIAIVLITVPVFSPVVAALGYDPVWCGILFAMNIRIYMLSPPFGPACFHLKSVAHKDVTLPEIYLAVLPFILLQMIGLALVMARDNRRNLRGGVCDLPDHCCTGLIVLKNLFLDCALIHWFNSHNEREDWR